VHFPQVRVRSGGGVGVARWQLESGGLLSTELPERIVRCRRGCNLLLAVWGLTRLTSSPLTLAGEGEGFALRSRASPGEAGVRADH